MVNNGDIEMKESELSLEAQIRDLLISELGTKSFDHLLELSPPIKVISEIRKHTIYSGTAMSTNAKDRFGLEGNGPEELIMPFYWLHACTSHENYSPPEVRENGVVFELYSCPLSKARPEICVAVSHHVAEGICRTMNPDVEFIFTHHLTNGDGRCRYIVRRKGQKGSFNDLGDLIKVIPRIELTEDERMYLGDQSMIFILTYIFSVASDLGVEDELLANLEPELKAIGKRLALFLENELSGELEGKEGMLRAISICQKSMMMLGELNEPMGTGGLNGKVTTCPFQGSPILACKEFELVMRGVCEVIYPDYEFAYHCMMTRGDEFCTWELRRKFAESSNAKSVPTREEDDPLKVLSLRLARGEISEGEYERKVQLILKHHLRV